MVVLPESNHEGIRTMAEKLRYVTENELYDFADQPVKVTVSVGVSVYEVGNHQSAKSLLNVADLALLSAKQAGGNCVVSKNVDDRAMRNIVPNTVGVYRSSARDYLGQ